MSLLLKLLVALSALFAGGCALSSSSQSTSTRDGLSYGSAFQLRANNHGEGVLAEHAWLSRHFPDARLADKPVKNSAGDEVVYFAHTTTSYEGKIYSIYAMQFPDDSVVKIYFDQSGYFGK